LAFPGYHNSQPQLRSLSLELTAEELEKSREVIKEPPMVTSTTEALHTYILKGNLD